MIKSGNDDLILCRKRNIAKWINEGIDFFHSLLHASKMNVNVGKMVNASILPSRVNYYISLGSVA